MAEALLIGQNGSSDGSSSVNLMDLYDSTKYDWYYTTLSDLTTPINQAIATIRNNKGYLIGVAFSDGNASLTKDAISYKVYINKNKVLDTTHVSFSGSGSKASGIINTAFTIANSNFRGDQFFNILRTSTTEQYTVPYTGAITSSTTENQLLLTAAPIPFTSLEVDFTSTLSSYNSSYSFILLYVLEKS